eukprot:129515-Rhodomonas_salina.1
MLCGRPVRQSTAKQGKRPNKQSHAQQNHKQAQATSSSGATSFLTRISVQRPDVDGVDGIEQPPATTRSAHAQ